MCIAEMPRDVSKLVAIVGCGPAGLAAAKELKQAGFTPINFDAQCKIGGVWVWGWDSLTLTTSSVHTAFSDFPARCEPKIWTRDEYQQYLEDYVDAFNIREHLHLNTKVVSAHRKIRPTGKWTWIVEVEGECEQKVWEVGALFIATGTNHVPTRITYPGQETFTGKVMHTKDFKRGEDFQGLRVVMQGMGESGSDLAYEVAKHSAKSYLSIRRTAGWVVPRLRKGVPADLVTNRILWGLPRAVGPYISHVMATGDSQVDNDKVINAMGKYNFNVLEKGSNNLGIYGTFGTKNHSFVAAMVEYGAEMKGDIASVGPGNKVTFVDGSEVEADVVLQNTGFKYCFGIIKTDGDKLLEKVMCDAQDTRNLWKKTLHPDLGARLVFTGFCRPAFGSQPPTAEMQDRLAVLVLSGKIPLPDKETIKLQIELDRNRCMMQFGQNYRIKALDDYILYNNDVASIIGAHPGSFIWMALTDPFLCWNLVFGPHINAQFRLKGPGANPQLVRATMQRYTVPLAKLRKIRLFLIALTFWIGCFIISLLPLPGMEKWRPVGWESTTHFLSTKELKEELCRRKEKKLIKY